MKRPTEEKYLNLLCRGEKNVNALRKIPRIAENGEEMSRIPRTAENGKA